MSGHNGYYKEINSQSIPTKFIEFELSVDETANYVWEQAVIDLKSISEWSKCVANSWLLRRDGKVVMLIRVRPVDNTNRMWNIVSGFSSYNIRVKEILLAVKTADFIFVED